MPSWRSLRAAAVAADYEIIRKLGHAMKGSGGGFGFDALTEIGATLELAAKQKNLAVMLNALDRLADYLAQVAVVYEEP